MGLVKALSPLPHSIALIGQNSLQLSYTTNTHGSTCPYYDHVKALSQTGAAMTISTSPDIFVRLLCHKPITAFGTHM
jgi:hypothetical protein